VSDIKDEIIYLFKIFGVNKKTTIEVVLTEDRSAPSIGRTPDHTFQVSENFINRKLSARQLNNNCLFELENRTPDYISSAFFFLTSWQEHNDTSPDSLGRFQYKSSYQSRFNNAGDNLVQHCFDKIASTLGIKHNPEKSTFFLSHDIDSVYGSILEDGFYVLKKGRVDIFLRFLFKVAMGKPEWLNMDQIMKIESMFDCRSTFFWIVNKGRINARSENADYHFQSPSIQRQFKKTETNGFENGIHKSISDETFDEEIKKYGATPLANRYHYLKFNLPRGYTAVERAGLKLDASLGFSECWGFRNSYGLPFNPFNFHSKQPYAFVEAPLHIMDRTFFSRKMEIGAVDKEIFNFFEKNKTDCVLSVLWHNNFFSDFKYNGYLPLYKKILQYIKEHNFGTIGQQEIIKKYSISWP
jgi:hypothetical protein